MFASLACSMAISVELTDCVGAGDAANTVALELGAALGVILVVGRAVGLMDIAILLGAAVGAADGGGVGLSVLAFDGVLVGAVEGNIVMLCVGAGQDELRQV